MMTRMEKDMVILNQLAASRQENEKPSAELLKKLGETHHSPTTVEVMYTLHLSVEIPIICA